MQLDDEEIKEHLNILKYQGFAVKLVLPFNHRKNLAECAFQTHQNYLIVGISGIDPSLPMTLWDMFIPQAIITINLLRNSKFDQKLSACIQI